VFTRRWPWRAWLCGLAVALALGLGGPAHAAVWIRLVDAATGVPLEFWEKTLAQEELRNPQEWRMPDAVFVDGTALPFSRYGGDAAAGTLAEDKDGETIPGMAEIEKELGAAAPVDEEVNSERAAEVQGGTGLRAQVSVNAADGEHRVHPGGHAFHVLKGEATEAVAPLVKVSGTQLRLPCRPVDIGVPDAFLAKAHSLAVSSGGHEVFREEFAPGKGLAVRLYLPESDEGYRFNLAPDMQVEARLEADGLRLAAEPRLPDGLGLDIHGAALTLHAVPPPVQARTSAAAAGPGLFLFTDRNRSVYMEGERAQVSLRALGAAAGAETVRLSLAALPAGAGAAPVELPPVVLTRRGDRADAEIELHTTALRPGAYELTATGGGMASNPLPLRVVSAMPATDMKLFGYCKWGSSSFDPKDLDAARRNGLNLVVQGGSHSQGGGVVTAGAAPFETWGLPDNQVPVDPARRARWPSPHTPPELLETQLEHTAGAEFLLANGIGNVPLLCGMILYFNVGAHWQHHADDRNQAVQMAGQEWRRYPNFTGMVHTSGDGPTPATIGMVWAAGPSSFDIIHDERMQKLREAFEFSVGRLTVDDSAVKAEFERVNAGMRGAWGFGVGMRTDLKVEGEAGVKREWARWVNDLYPAAFREERKALAALMPEPLVTCSTTWGQGIGGGMWTETFYAPLSHAVTDLHGDYGIVPLAYSSGTDLLNLGRRSRPWVSLDLLPERPFANGLKLFLEGLSRNPAGIGALNLSPSHVAGGWGYRKVPGEGMATLMDIGRRFGNVFLELERRDEIAILASMRQAALDGQSFGSLYGAHFLATKAGYQPVFITESECLAGPAALAGYKAVFLVNMTQGLPPELETALAGFQKQGGRVIADAKSVTALPGVLRVALDELNGSNETNFQEIYTRFEPLTETFRQTVWPAVPRFFTVSAPHVHAVRSTDQDIEYWTVFNDTLLSKDENPNGHFVQFLYKGVETDIEAARGGVLYDALRRQPVQTRPGAAGGMAWHTDMRLLPGTLYLCADRPLARLALTLNRSVAPGEALAVGVQVLDEAGKPFAGRLPVEVVVTDPGGAERYRVYRATNRELKLKIAGNDPAGEWACTAVEQATGLTARATFRVEGPGKPPAVEAADDSVYDAAAIHKALHDRELEIALYPSQLALKATAERLASDLAAAGAKVSVRVLWPSAQRTYPMNWKEWTAEDSEVHAGILDGRYVGLRVQGKNQHGTMRRDSTGQMAFYSHFTGAATHVYYRDLILLGRGDLDNGPMLDLIGGRWRMLPRNPSPSFPADGRGLLAYAWAPFHYGHDAVVAYGQDAAGLDRAVAALVGLAKSATAPVPPPTPVWGRGNREYGQTYAALGLPVAGGQTQTVTGGDRLAASLLPAMHSLDVREACLDAERLLARFDNRLDAKGPVFAAVNLSDGTAKRFNPVSGTARAGGLDRLARSLGREAWAARLMLAVGDDSIVPVDRGVARVDARGVTRWFFDPFPTAATLGEAQYPRRCQAMTLTPDGKSLLATFYDLGSGGGYGPRLRMFNQGATVLLDAENGKELGRAPGFLASFMAVADDGARWLLVDNVVFDDQGRHLFAPEDGTWFAAFQRDGREICRLPATGVARLAASRNGKLAALSYDDTRKYVSIVDVEKGVEHRVEYPRMDVGMAVAPDGAFAVIAYADGLLRKVAPSGETIAEFRLPAPAAPVVDAGGRILACGSDGVVRVVGEPPREIPFGDAPVEILDLPEQTPPPGLVRADTLAPRALPAPLETAPLPRPAGLAETLELNGTHKLTLATPAELGPLDVILLSFRCQLRSPQDKLTATVAYADRTATYIFPYTAEAAAVSVPVRPRGGQSVEVSLTSVGGAALTGIGLQRLNLHGFTNAAATAVGRAGANPQAPKVMVPNVHGALGDPRVEQMAYGFPDKGEFPLPPDVKPPVHTDAFSYFDGDVLAGTPLYPTVRPGKAPWDPPQALATLRSAQVVLDFARPVTVAAVGVWEHPSDAPVSAFAVEYCGGASEAGLTRELTGDWKLAFEARGNRDYYHVHPFAKPLTGKVWRYTVLDTPSAIQRLAELELYQSLVDSLETELGEPDTPADDFGL